MDQLTHKANDVPALQKFFQKASFEIASSPWILYDARYRVSLDRWHYVFSLAIFGSTFHAYCGQQNELSSDDGYDYRGYRRGRCWRVQHGDSDWQKIANLISIAAFTPYLASFIPRTTVFVSTIAWGTSVRIQNYNGTLHFHLYYCETLFKSLASLICVEHSPDM